MGLDNRVTPIASSVVINGTVGAPATARPLGGTSVSRLQSSDGIMDTGTSYLDQNLRGPPSFLLWGHPRPPNPGQVT